MKKITILFFLVFITGSLTTQTFLEQNSGVTVNLTSASINQTAGNYYDNAYNVWICGYSGIVLWTDNAGTNWLNIGGNGIPGNINLVNIFCIDTITALTCGNIGTVTYIYKTNNKGNNWNQVFSQTNGCINAMWMKDITQGFMCGNPVGGRWSLWKTTNGGNNWDSTGLYLPQSGSEIGWNNSLMAAGNRIWFGTNNTRIYFSSNYGTNWQVLSTSPEMNSSALYFFWGDSVYGYFGGTNSYKTTNSGYNWFPLNCSGTGNFVGFVSGMMWPFSNYYNPMIDFAVRNDSNIYFNNNMSDWGKVYSAPSGFYRHIAPATEVYSRYGLYSWAVRSNGGITRVQIFWPGGVKKISSEIPNNFSLFQNYPNPFNPTTHLRFGISELRFVKLVIYDILGHEVATLVNEKLQPGTYEVEWSATGGGLNLSSGVYFYQLKITNEKLIIEYKETKRMVLVK